MVVEVRSERRVGENLSIFQKGLILVAVPLLFQLAFITAAWWARAEAEHVQERHLHSQEVIVTAERTLRLSAEVHSAVRGYVVTSDPTFLKVYETGRSSLPATVHHLEELVADSRTQGRRARAMAAGVRRLLAWVEETKQFVDAGNHEEAAERVRRRTGQNEISALRDVADELLDQEERRDQERRDAVLRSQRRLDWLFVVGTVLAFLAAILMTWLLMGTISRRLELLTENTRRYAEERELSAPIPGTDEVSRLDQAFRKMAGALDEARQREKAYAASLEARSASLEAANRELQNFASVASHDLQEPLRKIQAFGDRLREKFSDGLGEQGRDYLERMWSAACRMRTLIDDLLAFSRLQTKAKPFELVDLQQIAEQVVSDLEGRIQQSSGEVILGELPTIEADATQMRQLFQNLIGNGLKFRRPDVPPVVEVSATRIESPVPDADGSADRLPGEPAWRIIFRDNGIGFDEKYLDRIFDVFQRLHGRGEYEGTGMGLAICRRIVIRHGGQITAETEPGQGATFLVTLPVRQPHEPEPQEENSL
jgi:signal transduction histidine kinase